MGNGVIVETIERLTNDTRTLGYFPLLILTSLDTARQGFDRNRDWTIMFKEESFRQDLFAFYQELNIASRAAQALEGYAASPQYAVGTEGHQYLVNQRNALITKFGELVAKGRSLIGRIDTQ